MNIGIIGSGNVGITSAFAIAEKGAGDILLYDVVEGRAAGKALDLAEASPIRRYEVGIGAVESIEELSSSGILVISAGRSRTEDEDRFDLFEDNLSIIRELAQKIKAIDWTFGPPTVLMLTEPVDLMTLAFLKETGWPKEKVMGVSGVLSTARLRRFIATELNISPEDVDAMVVGSHGRKMVILERYCRISGLPLHLLMSREQIDTVFKKTVEAGDLIVELGKRGSSFYTPGAAVGYLVNAIARDENRVASVSVLLNGEYGIEGQCLSVPVKLGSRGIEKIYELQLTEEEKTALKESAESEKPFLEKI